MVKKINIPKSLRDVNNIDEDDFLLIKHSTLSYLKVDLFVAEDSPLHDNLETLKSDLLPARGAVASAKNRTELQVALLQLGQKVKAVQKIAKAEKLETVEHYLARVAILAGLDDPKLYFENKFKAMKKERINLEKEKKSLIRIQDNYEEKNRKNSVDINLLSASAKVLYSVFRRISQEQSEIREKRLLEIDRLQKSNNELLNNLKLYDKKDWINVGASISPWHSDYQLVKGQAIEVLKKFSLESIGVEPGASMQSRDVMSFLTQTNNLSSLLASRVGITDNSIGLGNKLSLLADNVDDVSAKISSSGSSIISVGRSSGNDFTSAWTHALVNYGVSKISSMSVNDSVSSNDKNDSSINFKETISVSGKKYIELLDSNDSVAVKDFNKSFDMNSMKEYWGNVLGLETSLNLSIEEKALLYSNLVTSSVKERLMGDSSNDLGVIGSLYYVGANINNDIYGIFKSLELRDDARDGIENRLGSTYKELRDASSYSHELSSGKLAESLKEGLKNDDGLSKVDLNPARVQIYGKYLGDSLFPATSIKQSNLLGDVFKTTNEFDKQTHLLLGSILGSSSLVPPSRDLVNEEKDILSKRQEGLTENKVNTHLLEINEPLIKDKKLEMEKGLKSGINSLDAPKPGLN